MVCSQATMDDKSYFLQYSCTLIYFRRKEQSLWKDLVDALYWMSMVLHSYYLDAYH